MQVSQLLGNATWNTTAIKFRKVMKICLLTMICSLIGLATTPTKADEAPLTILSASSLTVILTAAAEQFEAQTGTKSRISFASSSALARQIEAGAPADLYFSANTKWMDYLLEGKLVRQDMQDRAISNQLVLIAPAFLKAKPVKGLNKKNLTAMVGQSGRIAIGDPDHVPVGLYGKAAFKKAGLWPIIEPRLARTDSTRAALAMVHRGETNLGVVYKTDAYKVANVEIVYTFPPETVPIRYAFAVTTTSSNPQAEAFFKFLSGPKGKDLFKSFGFAILTK